VATTVRQPHTITVKEYWVQVAAFKSHTRAESLNEQLRQLGYAGTIKTTAIEGETLFRVRLGPYANNSEAEKFKNWLIGIKGLEGSYVSQTINKKTIN
jgi:cell division septation protein DedD